MTRKARTLISVAVIAALAALCALIHAGTARERALRTCEGIRVEYADGYRFVSEEDIKDYLDKYYGAYIGQRLDSIRLHKVESILDVQSAILKSEAYTTEDGMLNIRLTQREPVIRFQSTSGGYYADADGFLFPLQNRHTVRVPVVDGALPLHLGQGYKGIPQTEEERTWVLSMLELVRWLGARAEWNDLVCQITTQKDGNLVLVPREGSERFLFGTPTGIPGKFDRIQKYYESVAPSREKPCRLVDVRYEGQIICKK